MIACLIPCDSPEPATRPRFRRGLSETELPIQSGPACALPFRPAHCAWRKIRLPLVQPVLASLSSKTRIFGWANLRPSSHCDHTMLDADQMSLSRKHDSEVKRANPYVTPLAWRSRSVARSACTLCRFINATVIHALRLKNCERDELGCPMDVVGLCDR